MKIVSRQAYQKTIEKKADIEKVEEALESHSVGKQEHLYAGKVSHTNKLYSGSS